MTKENKIIFESIMDAFNKNIETLTNQNHMDRITFKVPHMFLSKEDMMDLSLMVVKKINATVEFNFKKSDQIIEVTIRRVGGGI